MVVTTRVIHHINKYTDLLMNWCTLEPKYLHRVYLLTFPREDSNNNSLIPVGILFNINRIIFKMNN